MTLKLLLIINNYEFFFIEIRNFEFIFEYMHSLVMNFTRANSN